MHVSVISDDDAMGTQRTILITGCSSGIGLDAAQTLKKDGWRVFASCRKEEDCRRLKSEGFESPLIDYSKGETIESGLKEVLDATGGTLDALFNNGAYGVGGAAEDVPTGLLREIFECNFFGWVDLTNRCVKIFRNQGNVGRVVQCSSILGNVVFPMRMAYSSTKFALEAYCDALRLELKDQPGIKIVSLNVGPIRTMIREKSVPHFDKWMKPLVPSSAFRSFYEKKFMPRLYGPYKKDPFELEPEAVTRKLKLALTCTRPRPRYAVTVPTHAFMFLKRVLPGYVLDWICLYGIGLWRPGKGFGLHP